MSPSCKASDFVTEGGEAGPKVGVDGGVQMGEEVPEFDADWGLETLVHVGEHWIDSLLKVSPALLPCSTPPWRCFSAAIHAHQLCKAAIDSKYKAMKFASTNSCQTSNMQCLAAGATSTHTHTHHVMVSAHQQLVGQACYLALTQAQGSSHSNNKPLVWRHHTTHAATWKPMLITRHLASLWSSLCAH